MAHSATRTLFSGIAYLHEPGGHERPFPYKGSYSDPRRDQQGCIRFGWTATIVGMHRQPLPRTTIVHEPGSEPASELVERSIHRAIEEHLAAFASEAQGKIA